MPRKNTFKCKKFNRHAKNKSIEKSTKHVSNTFDKKRKNFKFIKRSKEAEETQRRQKIVEDKYRTRNLVQSESESDADEQNPLEQLLSTFMSENEVNPQYKAIESSSDSESDEGNDMNIEEDQNEIEENPEVLESNVSEKRDDMSDENLSLCDKISITSENEEIDNLQISDEEILCDQTSKKCLLDPFSIHLDYELSSDHIENLLSKPCVTKKSIINWPELGNLQIEISKESGNKVPEEKNQKKSNKTLLSEEEIFASEGVNPKLVKVQELDLVKLYVKSKITSNLAQNTLNSFQCELFSIFNNYQDFFYPQRNFRNCEDIRYAYCLHALNHMLKTRSKILHHNAKLLNIKSTGIISDSFQDQGLVRPKVLILLPFRDSAFRTVNFIISLMFGDKEALAKTNGSIINYKRFEEEYTGDTIRFPKTNPKPDDYQKTFSGNTDDSFRIGISFTKKTIKLYTEFYSSDILLASPLGLRMIVGASGDTDRDYDFLNSIELLILDQAELFLAQNWDHFLHVLDHMHLQPQTVKNTDFSRVRPWCLNGYSKYYRQTLFFTSHELPEFRSVFNNKCFNYRGKIKVCNEIKFGSISNILAQVSQVFHKIQVSSIESSFDERFKYFITEILPQFKNPSMAHCMIYVPSYFDYVRLRNYMKSESINFVQICEYTEDGKMARARDMFFHSSAHFLLYSERAHFFRRTRIKGIRHLIIYQPPVWPNFYSEIINLMQDFYQNPRDGLESTISVTVLYTKYDMLQIASIIGTQSAKKMIESGKSTHMFTTGD